LGIVPTRSATPTTAFEPFLISDADWLADAKAVHGEWKARIARQKEIARHPRVRAYISMLVELCHCLLCKNQGLGFEIARNAGKSSMQRMYRSVRPAR